MNIGFFTNTYLPNVFGLTTSIETFRKGLEERGHTVYIFAPKFQEYEDLNKHVIRYPALQWNYKIQYSIPFSYYPPINTLIDQLGLDVIHVHQPFSVAKDGLRQGRRLGIPVVYTHHTRYEDYAHYVPLVPQRVLGWHLKGAATRFANLCDQVIAPSAEIKQLIEQRGVVKPIQVLPTGIDWSKYAQGDREGIRQRYGLQPDEICLLWTGRMEAEKNVPFFVEVAMKIVRHHDKVKVLLVGDGSERKELEQLVAEKGLSERIIFTGLVPQTEIYHYYVAGDIFLQTSLTETQGITTTEALAAGLAVIAVRATGSVDLIEHEKNGLLVEHDKKKVIFAVEDLFSNKTRRAELGRTAREMAKQWDYKERARELEVMYQRLLHDQLQVKANKKHANV